MVQMVPDLSTGYEDETNYFFFQFLNSEEVDQLARNLGCRLIRTSVKEDVNVSSVFRYLATKCHQIMMQQYNVVPVGQPQISK